MESQRWRLMVAAAQLFTESGERGMRSGEVARRARVSLATLYEHFHDVDECLLAAHEMAAECLWDALAAACAQEAGQARLRLAAVKAAELFAAEPVIVRLLGAEAATAVAAIASARERLLSRLAAHLADELRPRGRPVRVAGGGAERLLLDGAFGLLDLPRPADPQGAAEQVAELLTQPLRACPG